MNPDLERLRDDIKRTMTMDEVLRILGLPEPNRQRKIRSIFNPNERTPSLHIYDYDWYDYSTGQGGDQISFVMAYQSVPYVKALEILGRGMPLAVRPRRDNEVPFEVPNFTARFQSARDSQSGEDWARLEEYVKEKWPYLTVGDIMAFPNKLVKNGELWSAHWVSVDGGLPRVAGIKVRNIYDGSKYAVQGSCFIAGLYRPLPNRPNRTHALLVEGESDAWVMAKMLDRRDVTVLALPSGAGAWRPRFVDELSGFETVGVAVDADEAGEAAIEKIMGDLPNAYRVNVPGGRVAEAAADGWRL